MTRNNSAGTVAKGSLRIQVLSDLHTELASGAEPAQADVATGADVVVLAGDIARAPDTIAVATRMFRNEPLVLVAGNHESYLTGLTIDEGVGAMRRAADAHGSVEHRPIHVLEDEEAIIEVSGVPVRFLGSTLWTDFALFGDPVLDRMVVEQAFNDFRAIRGRAVNLLGLFLGGGGTPFRTSEWLERHDASRAFLRSRLSVPHRGPTIVVTHHLPSIRSVAQRYRHSRLSAGFASRLDDLVGMGSTLWIHGHTHDPALWRDEASGTLVVCNPAGYASQSGARENRAFDPKLVVAMRRTREVWRADVLPGAEVAKSDAANGGL